MHKIIDLLLKRTNSITGRITNSDIALNSLFFALSSIIGLKRGYIETNGTRRYINFFGITIGQSGEGKDISLMVCENMFPILNTYKDIVLNNFNKLHKELPNGNKNDEENYLIPYQYKVALEGTKEGMMRIANFYNQTDIGSLNVISNEFGHDIQSSTTIPTLTKLWQEAKADGSTNVNEKYPPVNNVPTNILLFGSPSPFNKKESLHNKLTDMIESGLARRTFFVWSEPREIVEFYETVDDKQLKEIGIELTENIRHHDQRWEFTNDAQERIKEYRTQLINQYNTTKRLWDNIKIANIDKIERLSAIISILDYKSQITKEHIDFAIEISEKSDQAMEKILKPSMAYVMMYDLLLQNPSGMAQSEMNELGLNVKNQKEFKDQILLLEEYAYRFNKKIKQVGRYKFRLEDLPVNDLSKIIVSVNTEKKGARGVIGEPMELPFFDDPRSIEQLVRSSKIDWFSFVHFENKKRKSVNAIERQNLIAFDIDDGTLLEEGRALVQPYTNIIYTTRNHQIEKKGIIADRYRILIPTKTEFSVTPEQHKEMMKNVAESLGLKIFDISTRNIDRLWFSNPNAIVYTNKAELFDISCCLPETENSSKIEQATKDISYDDISTDKRIEGAIRWALQTAIIGNRNNTLFKLRKMLEDSNQINLSSEEAKIYVHKVNSMLPEPLNDYELNKTVLR